VFFALVHFQS